MDLRHRLADDLRSIGLAAHADGEVAVLGAVKSELERRLSGGGGSKRAAVVLAELAALAALPPEPPHTREPSPLTVEAEALAEQYRAHRAALGFEPWSAAIEIAPEGAGRARYFVGPRPSPELGIVLPTHPIARLLKPRFGFEPFDFESEGKRGYIRIAGVLRRRARVVATNPDLRLQIEASGETVSWPFDEHQIEASAGHETRAQWMQAPSVGQLAGHLTDEQLALLATLENTSLLIDAPAGAGKTIVALFRLAAQLDASPAANAAYFVRTNTLAAYVRDAVRELGLEGRVTVQTLHAWAQLALPGGFSTEKVEAELGQVLTSEEIVDAFEQIDVAGASPLEAVLALSRAAEVAKRCFRGFRGNVGAFFGAFTGESVPYELAGLLALADLRRSDSTLPSYDYVVADEAQDFGASALVAMFRACRNRDRGGITICTDPNQRIWPSIAEVDVRRVFERWVGRSISLPSLPLSVRCPPAAAQLAQHFVRGTTGTQPVVCERASTREAVAKKIAEDCRELMASCPGQTVMILYPTSPARVWAGVLKGALHDMTYTKIERDVVAPMADVRIATFAYAKGLEADHVRVIVDGINGMRDEVETRNELYTAVTRAVHDVRLCVAGNLPTVLSTAVDAGVLRVVR